MDCMHDGGRHCRHCCSLILHLLHIHQRCIQVTTPAPSLTTTTTHHHAPTTHAYYHRSVLLVTGEEIVQGMQHIVRTAGVTAVTVAQASVSSAASGAVLSGPAMDSVLLQAMGAALTLQTTFVANATGSVVGAYRNETAGNSVNQVLAG